MSRSEEAMECLLLLLFILETVFAGVSPIYSQSYSTVSTDGAANTQTLKSNHMDDHLQKDVQQKSVPENIANDSKTAEGVYPTSDTLIPNEITLEPESEQIDFVFSPKKTENIELSEESENIDGQIDTKVSDLSPSNEQGVYYIFHPNGILQKVVFATIDDPERGQYTANLNYQNVQPIVEPVYTYDPKTFVFQRLQLFSN
ncbi:unnamed protein product [Phaedon cochleariae]|uniref:Uncharacterized protein n=1 Tax=Phaedon cochleariae TaxID=80249 RepID=A0A9N9X4V2_PHACE|nr:unnamed protein product [Phaedon cochleariae]